MISRIGYILFSLMMLGLGGRRDGDLIKLIPMTLLCFTPVIGDALFILAIFMSYM